MPVANHRRRLCWLWHRVGIQESAWPTTTTPTPRAKGRIEDQARDLLEIKSAGRYLTCIYILSSPCLSCFPHPSIYPLSRSCRHRTPRYPDLLVHATELPTRASLDAALCINPTLFSPWKLPPGGARRARVPCIAEPSDQYNTFETRNCYLQQR